jgi:hypothetical protein
MPKPSFELTHDGHFIFYMCSGCGHVGISTTSLIPLCHHCKANDIEWQVVGVEDFAEDMKLIEQQLSSIENKKKGT